MSLILPNGLAPKKTRTLTEKEMQWLAMGEDVLNKLDLTLACPHCLRMGMPGGAVLRGNNDPSDPVLRVSCDCRMFVFQQRST